MTRRPTTTGFWQGRLPHWEVEGGRYFVTAHLAGAIPAQGMTRIQQISEELQQRSQQDCAQSSVSLMRTVFRELERWLDRTPANMLLAKAPIATMVTEAVEHRIDSGVWDVFEYVIMPSHLHLFLSVGVGTLKASMQDFKRWTGHQAAQLVQLPDGRFWQDEWFDHWSRSDDQDERISNYIRRNPVVAGLVENAEDWRWRR